MCSCTSSYYPARLSVLGGLRRIPTRTDSLLLMQACLERAGKLRAPAGCRRAEQSLHAYLLEIELLYIYLRKLEIMGMKPEFIHSQRFGGPPTKTDQFSRRMNSLPLAASCNVLKPTHFMKGRHESRLHAHWSGLLKVYMHDEVSQ